MANEQYLTNLTELPEGAQEIERQPLTPSSPPLGQFDRYQSGVIPQSFGGLQTDLNKSQIPTVAPVFRVQLPPAVGTPAFNSAVKSTAAPQIAAAIAAIPPSTSGGSGSLTDVDLTGPPNFITNTQSTAGTVETIAQTLIPQPPGLFLKTQPSGFSSIVGSPTQVAATGPVSITFTPPVSSGWFLYFSNIAGSATTTPTGWTGHGNGATLAFSSNATVTASEAGSSGVETWVNTVIEFSTSLPSFVQFTSATLSHFNGLGIPTNKAYGSNNTAGNTLVVVLKGTAATGQGPADMSFFDSNGNNYVLVSSISEGSTNGLNGTVQMLVFIAVNCIAGANTITAIAAGPASGGSSYTVELYEFGAVSSSSTSTPAFFPISPSDIPPLNASVIASGQIGLAQGGTASDLHATGGTSQYLAQLTSGAAITVQQPNFTDLAGTISGAQLAASIVKTGQTGSISAATLVPSPVTTALYQVNYYMNVTTAGTSGTVQATFTWNDGAAQTLNSATITFGTLGAFVSGTFIVKATSGTPQYSTTVTSALGSPVYSLDIRVLPLG